MEMAWCEFRIVTRKTHSPGSNNAATVGRPRAFLVPLPTTINTGAERSLANNRRVVWWRTKRGEKEPLEDVEEERNGVGEASRG